MCNITEMFKEHTKLLSDYSLGIIPNYKLKKELSRTLEVDDLKRTDPLLIIKLLRRSFILMTDLHVSNYGCEEWSEEDNCYSITLPSSTSEDYYLYKQAYQRAYAVEAKRQTRYIKNKLNFKKENK